MQESRRTSKHHWERPRRSPRKTPAELASEIEIESEKTDGDDATGPETKKSVLNTRKSDAEVETRMKTREMKKVKRGKMKKMKRKKRK